MDYIEINKKLWNEKTEIHYNSDFYDVKGFSEGRDSLNPPEIALLGDIRGKRVLHLQCHFGQDTISLSRRGAIATGIDFSEKAILKANELSTQLGADVRFIQCNVYELPEHLDETFDVIFTSYGVLGWLEDMDAWAGIINHFLKSGGELVMVEFHPVIWMFSFDFSRIEFNYADKTPIIEVLEGTYTDRKAPVKGESVNWNHGLSTVMNALIKKGLMLTDFQEYNYSPYNCFRNTVKVAAGKYQIKGLENKIPMLYSVKAVKPV